MKKIELHMITKDGEDVDFVIRYCLPKDGEKIKKMLAEIEAEIIALGGKRRE